MQKNSNLRKNYMSQVAVLNRRKIEMPRQIKKSTASTSSARAMSQASERLSGHPTLPDNRNMQFEGARSSKMSRQLSVMSHQSSALESRRNSAIPDGSHGPDCINEMDSTITETKDLIMSIDITENGSIGCAFFSTRDGCLSIAQDTTLADESTLQHYLEHIQPLTILSSSRISDKMNEILDHYVDCSYQAGSTANIQISTLPKSEFSPALARKRLSNLSPTFLHEAAESCAVYHSAEGYQMSQGALAREESTDIRHIRLSAKMGLNNPISTSCASVLLTEINQRRTSDGQVDPVISEQSYEILNVQEFCLSQYLYINSAALLSLQVLHDEAHPNTQTWSSHGASDGRKEGLSVYGLFQCLVSTSQGRTHLQKIFLRPSLHIPTIISRQTAIATILLPKNSEPVKQIICSLRKVPDMKGLMLKLSRGIDSTLTNQSSSRGLWAALARFCTRVAEVHRLTSSVSEFEAATLLRRFNDSVDVAAIVSVGSMINRTIDFEQSSSRERYSIRDGIDPSLDKLKRQYDGMESFLTEVVTRIIANSSSWARQYIKSCIFLPQLGFLLVVVLDEATGSGKYSGEGQNGEKWEMIFVADDTVCYKTDEMRELDGAYGDVYCQIGDREVELLHELASAVLEQRTKLEQASELCGELDAVLALALGAEKYRWNQPRVGQSPNTVIKGGRHPLHELSVPVFIPNDFGSEVEGLGDQLERVLVMTGPNHSGKSVYLKQVALIVYLAHIGSFVPADVADISTTDKILVCTPVQETAASNESAFAADLKVVYHTVRHATEKSLVVVDEFGKGTCPVNGAGLVAGLLEYFLSLGDSHCPRVLLATHFHEVFEFVPFDCYDILRFAYLDVNIKGDTDSGDDPLTYLFSLKSGRSSSSFGEQCAALNGVPNAVIERARAISSVIDRNEDLAVTCATLSSIEKTQLEAAEDISRRFISSDLRGWKSSEATQRAIELLDELKSIGSY